jgi:mRNA-degrading endonuclease RelE of RelBE toxin-antitoxin system
MYELEVSDLADKKFYKIAKKNKVLFEAINKKIDEIKMNPEHFKSLRGDMKGQRRVHFGHFVLTFEIIYERGVVKVLDFDHHDKIYEN